MKTQTGDEKRQIKRAPSLRSWRLESGPDLCRLGSELKPDKKQLLVSLDCTLETKVLVHSRVEGKGGVGETKTGFIGVQQEACSE